MLKALLSKVILMKRIVFYPKAVRKQRIQDSLKAFSSVLLLVFYTVGNTQVEAIHRLLHSHSTSIAHLPEQERDTCHRTIYHQEKKACKHKVHLTKVDKCDFCQFVFHTDHIKVSGSSHLSLRWYSVITDGLTYFQYAELNDHLPSRAPPFIV
jgi:hypothetical protein